MSFKVTITDHPAVAQNPVDPSKKLIDNDDKPVPLFADHHAIRLDGVLVGYVLPKNKISLIVPEQRLTKVVVEEIERVVEAFANEKASEVNSVAEYVEPEDEEEYED